MRVTWHQIRNGSISVETAPHPADRPPSPRRRGEGDARRRLKSPLPACGERVRVRGKKLGVRGKS
ncbi:hypothetical protein EPK84_02670 (plasmid) [Sinorhizobium fredii]|nr:hypothetical protein EPK84_02670 [Sinorhizobium fredii]